MADWARSLGGLMIVIGLLAAGIGVIMILWNFSSGGVNPVGVLRGFWAIYVGLPLAVTGMVLDLLGSLHMRLRDLERRVSDVADAVDRGR